MNLPDSIYLYCTDSRVRSAVNLLLSGKSPKVPDGLGWDELGDFYRACLAAQQTKAEWAIAMNDIWHAVFHDQIKGWRPSSITEQVTDGVPVDIANVWSDGEFTRDLVRDDFCLEAQVEIDVDEGMRANVALYDAGTQLSLPAPTGMSSVQDWVCSAWTPFSSSPTFDLSRIRAQAQEAIKAVNTVVGNGEHATGL